MKAFILAAGLGSRLGDLTKNKPKALVQLNGQALLGRLIIQLKNQGFDQRERFEPGCRGLMYTSNAWSPFSGYHSGSWLE